MPIRLLALRRVGTCAGPSVSVSRGVDALTMVRDGIAPTGAA